MAADPETGIITEEKLTKAAGPANSDPSVAGEFVQAEDEPHEWYGDSAYGTGDLRDVIEDRDGDEAVLKPKPLHAPVPGGFTVDDFTVDEQAGTVTCPAGHTRPVSRKRHVTFGAVCRDCPLGERCTKSKTGRKIVPHPHDGLLRTARRDWAADPDLRERYRTYRPNVERVISQITSRGGRRLKLRYRGTSKNHAWLTRRTAGLNLRNLIGRGLTYTGVTWTLPARRRDQDPWRGPPADVQPIRNRCERQPSQNDPNT